MEYRRAWHFLHALRGHSSSGTGPFRHLLTTLDDPHEGVDCVRIVGSRSGSGTARMASRILEETDHRVGLYSTSHVDEVRERVRIDGVKIPEVRVSAFVEEVRDEIVDLAASGAPPTFTQTMLALALWEFAYRDVDFGVIEVESQTEFTTTNMVTPETTAISDLADSDELLRNSIENYLSGTTDAGTQVPLVIPARTLEERGIAAEIPESITTVGSLDGEWNPDIIAEYTGRDGTTGTARIEGEGWSVKTTLQILGERGVVGAGVAVGAVLDVADPTEPGIDRGLRTARTPGQSEILSREPLVILDSADDREGCRCLMDLLDEFEYDRRHLVVGGERDVDYRGIAEVFSGSRLGEVIACQPEGNHAENVEIVERAIEREVDAEITTRGDGGEGAVDEVLARADDGDAIVVTGSSSVVREARKRWSRQFVTKDVTDISDSKKVLENAHVTSPGVWRIRGKGVHRAVKTRLRRRAAQYVKLEMLSLGGECAISGLSNQHGEYFDVVLLGTLAQYKRLAEKLDNQPYGLSPFADKLRNAVGIGTSGSSRAHPWGENSAVVGILDIGQQSDGRQEGLADATEQEAIAMVETGVDILDVTIQPTASGEHPGVREERERVTAAVETLSGLDVSLCVTTLDPSVARSALDTGADALYSRSAVLDPDLIAVAADHDVPVVIRASTPASPDEATGNRSDDVVEDTIDALAEAVLLAERVGVPRSRVVLDPAVGRIQSTPDRLEMIARLDELHALGSSVLVNRPAEALADEVDIRPTETLPRAIASIVAVERGADIVRVVDPGPVVTAVRTRRVFDDIQ